MHSWIELTSCIFTSNRAHPEQICAWWDITLHICKLQMCDVQGFMNWFLRRGEMRLRNYRLSKSMKSWYSSSISTSLLILSFLTVWKFLIDLGSQTIITIWDQKNISYLRLLNLPLVVYILSPDLVLPTYACLHVSRVLDWQWTTNKIV